MTEKKKKKHLEVENYVLFNGFLNTTAQDKASQIVLRNCSAEVSSEEARGSQERQKILQQKI